MIGASASMTMVEAMTLTTRNMAATKYLYYSPKMFNDNTQLQVQQLGYI